MSAETYSCFLLVPTLRYRIKLRRHVSRTGRSEISVCPAVPLATGYHNAVADLGREAPFAAVIPQVEDILPEDPHWPVLCVCGYRFRDQDSRQVYGDLIYTRSDTQEEITVPEAPPGAIWEAPWLAGLRGYGGTDGKVYMVKLPGGRAWTIDSPSSNCTKPDDYEHRCWVRHGDAPCFTVDKNGNTCTAGAGSIQVSGWHGFLTNGVLRSC